VRQALLHPDAGGREALRALGPDNGFVAIDDAHFIAVRRMVRTLESW
jgi:hypothetical protein